MQFVQDTIEKINAIPSYDGLVRCLCVPAWTTELTENCGTYQQFRRVPCVGELIGKPGGDDTLNSMVRVTGVLHRLQDAPVVFHG